MKFILSILLISFGNTAIKGQNVVSPASQVAEKIAGKMSDSLRLTNQQKAGIYTINMQLNNQKMSVRQLYAARDSVIWNVQKIENTRDSLYRQVLANDQFLLYGEKKKNLVNNN